MKRSGIHDAPANHAGTKAKWGLTRFCSFPLFRSTFRPPNTASSRHVFTLNNYTDVDVARLATLGSSDAIRYLVFGREVGDSGTPHLQGFVIWEAVKRFRAAKALIGDRCFLEPARGKSEQARDYCKKENDFEEYGEFPGKQGKRTDLESFAEWHYNKTSDDGRAPSLREVAQEHFSVAVKYPRAVAIAELRAPHPTPIQGDLRGWQANLETALNGEADDRTVLFFVDYNGGHGKSWFQRYYESHHPDRTQLLGVGKRDDMAHMIDPSKEVFLINVPRGAMQFLQYTILEQLKDKKVSSPKYHSRMKTLHKHPHVVVFCNEAPERSAMSADRYNVLELSQAPAMEPGIAN